MSPGGADPIATCSVRWPLGCGARTSQCWCQPRDHGRSTGTCVPINRSRIPNTYPIHGFALALRLIRSLFRFGQLVSQEHIRRSSSLRTTQHYYFFLQQRPIRPTPLRDDLRDNLQWSPVCGIWLCAALLVLAIELWERSQARFRTSWGVLVFGSLGGMAAIQLRLTRKPA